MGLKLDDGLSVTTIYQLAVSEVDKYNAWARNGFKMGKKKEQQSEGECGC